VRLCARCVRGEGADEGGVGDYDFFGRGGASRGVVNVDTGYLNVSLSGRSRGNSRDKGVNDAAGRFGAVPYCILSLRQSGCIRPGRCTFPAARSFGRRSLVPCSAHRARSGRLASPRGPGTRTSLTRMPPAKARRDRRRRRDICKLRQLAERCICAGAGTCGVERV
jgi:hypothetical protein